MHGPFDALRDVLARFDPKKSNLIPTSHLRNVLTKILPDLESVRPWHGFCSSRKSVWLLFVGLVCSLACTQCTLFQDWEVLLQEFAVGTFTDYQARRHEKSPLKFNLSCLQRICSLQTPNGHKSRKKVTERGGRRFRHAHVKRGRLQLI